MLSATAFRIRLVGKLLGQVFPAVETELAGWRRLAAAGSRELAGQALASLADKKFHCQGGSVFSLYPGVTVPRFIRLVVALQTISDYLDNLCDRAGIANEAAFRQLHLAMTDALEPAGPQHEYYAYYPQYRDGGYLAALVAACRQEIAALPAYDLIKAPALRLAGLYSDLQTYKHLDQARSEVRLTEWGGPYLADYPGLTVWEFAAASGSTLGLFVLCALASDPALDAATVDRYVAAYFPWVCGLHILLDYFIDLDEDRRFGDLNFVAYYRDDQESLARLILFRDRALDAARGLPVPAFTATVVEGLLAMYLSDPKAEAPGRRPVTATLLETAGRETRLMHTVCRLLRRNRFL